VLDESLGLNFQFTALVERLCKLSTQIFFLDLMFPTRKLAVPDKNIIFTHHNIISYSLVEF